MESQARPLTFLDDAGKIEIPFFQREYVWQKSNWEDLLNDLLHTEKSHFLGSLILKQQKVKTGDQGKVLVIDGQQRLTTLTILVKVLYDLFDNEIKDSIRNDLLKMLFIKEKATDKNFKLRITHSINDSKDYKKVIGEATSSSISQLSDAERDAIILDDNETKPPIISNDSKILQCYKYFYQTLSLITEDERSNLFNYLLNSNNKILVVIDLDEEDNEQEIFDTINSAGIRLSSTDIVKNTLFQRIIELYSEEEAIQYHQDFWLSVFSDNGAKLYWEQKKATGRLFRDNSEILLQAVAIIEGIYNPVDNTISELADLFKKKIFKSDDAEIIDLLKKIHEYAKVYKDSIPEINNQTAYTFNDNLLRLLKLCDVMEISTFHPYIVFLVKKYEDNQTALDNRLFNLEKYLIKVLISGATKKNFNKECSDLIIAEKNDDDTYIITRIDSIDNDKITKGLKYIANAQATFLLFWIELYRRKNDKNQAITSLLYNYTLEHILPQKWQEHWSNIPVYDNDCTTIITDDTKAKEHRSFKLYSIGNMTLLNGSLNTTVSNYDFERKIQGVPQVKGKKAKKGLKDYNELSLTKEILTPYNNGDKIWDERKITTREEKLKTEILEIWQL